MKKIFLTAVVFFAVSKKNFVHAQVKDTLTYLGDSIIAQKANFINKPLSVLFNNLKLPITELNSEIPFPYLPDTLTVTIISFSFYDPTTAINRLDNKTPQINVHVSFATPQRIPKKYFDGGQVLDWTTGWNSNKANYLGPIIISDMW